MGVLFLAGQSKTKLVQEMEKSESRDHKFHVRDVGSALIGLKISFKSLAKLLKLISMCFISHSESEGLS